MCFDFRQEPEQPFHHRLHHCDVIRVGMVTEVVVVVGTGMMADSTAVRDCLEKKVFQVNMVMNINYMLIFCY